MPTPHHSAWLLSLAVLSWFGCSDAQEGGAAETPSGPDVVVDVADDALAELDTHDVQVDDVTPSAPDIAVEEPPGDTALPDAGGDTGIDDAAPDPTPGDVMPDAEPPDAMSDTSPLDAGPDAGVGDVVADSGGPDASPDAAATGPDVPWLDVVADISDDDVGLPDTSSACDFEGVLPSNEGCAFTAVTTVNPDLGTLFVDDFAVVLANRADNPPAAVTITQGDVVVAEGEVPPGQTLTLALPMVSALVDTKEDSVLAPEAAYEVTSNVPVTATQFSPLHFQSGEDFAMSNDASLLLPHHVLTQSYTALGFPAWAYWIAWRTGFVTIAAIADDTQVTVTASSPIASGPLIAEMATGDVQTVTLHRGDVLQLLGWAPGAGIDNQITSETCDGPGWQYKEEGLGAACEAVDLDLTGTTVSASAPVAVFVGHSCLRVPYDSHACDHVEEQLFPDSAWGQEAVLTAPHRPDNDVPSVATHRVVAREADTVVTLTPDVAGPFTLGAGEQAQFTTDADVRVAANGPILAMTALHSAQGLEPPALDGSLPLSDPSIGLAVPLRQAREEYVFLTPDTFQSDWLNVVAVDGSEVFLDDVAITGWIAIPGTPYAVVRVPVSPGSHRATGEEPFTVMSYGYANHTSYLYPGGLNLVP